jgi:hypothetical protein
LVMVGMLLIFLALFQVVLQNVHVYSPYRAGFM